jgi:hypothetical protein
MVSDYLEGALAALPGLILALILEALFVWSVT